MHRSETPPIIAATVAARALADAATLGSDWFDFLARVHASLQLDEVAATTVNELRRLLTCDRVGLLFVSRGRAELIAASGQDSFDRRSNVARAWESFTEACAKLDEPFWYDETPTGRAPQIETALAHLLDVSPSRFLAVVPLRAVTAGDAAGDYKDRPQPRAGDIVGWLVVERFEHGSPETLGPGHAPPAVMRERLERIAPHVGAAVDNARRYDRLPLRRLGEKLDDLARGHFGSRWWKWGAIPAVLVVASLLIPAELKIEARGKLQPKERRNVFAPVDGIVSSIKVRHGSDVGADAVLLTIHSPDLDFELTRIEGEIQTAEKRQTSINTARFKADETERRRLTLEEEETKEQLAGLAKQLDELKKQRQALVVTSPLAGQVLTWDVEQTLDDRPVRKGQLLLSIGNVAADAKWELELQVPDDRISYVNDAARDRPIVDGKKVPLVVEFVSASAPHTTHQATVRETARRSEGPADGEAVVLVTADIGKQELPPDELRPGAAVVAKVHCGRTSLARSWLLDLIHVIRTEVLF
jgi:multidrug efflux pump subunit AcrA (membrane-fusion protein)